MKSFRMFVKQNFSLQDKFNDIFSDEDLVYRLELAGGGYWNYIAKNIIEFPDDIDKFFEILDCFVGEGRVDSPKKFKLAIIAYFVFIRVHQLHIHNDSDVDFYAIEELKKLLSSGSLGG